MSGFAPVTRFQLSKAGPKGVVISGDAWDELVTRINMLSAPQLNPPQNIGCWAVADNQIVLDLSILSQRLANVEARPYYTGATVNCIGNVATVTFTP